MTSPHPVSPDAISPDDKDWTWVLDQQCPECGFTAAEVTGPDVGRLVRSAAEPWPQVLARDDVRARPAPAVWSPLEYGAHVRDVLRLFDQRLALMLAENDPGFANWDQDETAVTQGYAEQAPAVVATELAAAADTAADRFDSVAPDLWTRTGRRSNGSVFTIESLGRYFLHDLVHHLHDVGAR